MECFQVWFYFHDEGVKRQRAILLDAESKSAAKEKAQKVIAEEGDPDFKISRVKQLSKREGSK